MNFCSNRENHIQQLLCLCYCVFILGFISLWWFVPLCLPNMTPLSIFNETEWKIIGVCCSHQEHGGQLNRLQAHQMVRGATAIICYRSSHSLLILSSPRAESARAVTGRRCPHSGRGEDVLSRQPDFFTETAVTPEQKVEKSFPRWEINRHVEG